MLISCKTIRKEVFNIFVVVVSVYDANFTVPADINVRNSDDLINGNCSQAVVGMVCQEPYPLCSHSLASN